MKRLFICEKPSLAEAVAEFLGSAEKKDGYYELDTNKGVLETKAVVNAAGVYADVMHNMVSDKKMKIVARKGEYLLMDKELGDYFKATIFPLPARAPPY